MLRLKVRQRILISNECIDQLHATWLDGWSSPSVCLVLPVWEGEMERGGERVPTKEDVRLASGGGSPPARVLAIKRGVERVLVVRCLPTPLYSPPTRCCLLPQPPTCRLCRRGVLPLCSLNCSHTTSHLLYPRTSYSHRLKAASETKDWDNGQGEDTNDLSTNQRARNQK